MGGLLGLARGIDRVNSFSGKTVGWAILIAILVSAGNAVVRKMFNVSSNAWLELQWYLYGVAFLGAAAYTLLENEHIRIDILYGHWSRRSQHWIDLIGHLFFLMPFVTLMIWLLWPWFWRSFYNGEMSNNAGGLPLWPAKSLLLVAFILLFFQGLSEIIKKIAIMRGRIEDPVAVAEARAGQETRPASPDHPLTDLAIDDPRDHDERAQGATGARPRDGGPRA